MISPAEFTDLRLLLRKLDRVLERQGAPKARRRFLDDVEMSIHWYNEHKEKKK